MQYFDLARQGLRAMAKRWQGAKAARKGFGALVGRAKGGAKRWQGAKAEPSKCRISTWQGRGKGEKVHRMVSWPSETCLAQVWKPFKCNIRPGKAMAKG